MTRDEAIKWLQGIEERYFNGGDEAYDKKRREAVRMAIESLEHKLGEWIAYNGDDPNWLRNDGSPVFMQCSECNTMVVNNFAFNWNYCPNCGADMRKILPKS